MATLSSHVRAGVGLPRAVPAGRCVRMRHPSLVTTATEVSTQSGHSDSDARHCAVQRRPRYPWGLCDHIAMLVTVDLSSTAVSVRAVGSPLHFVSHASAHSQSTTSCTFSARAVDVVMYRNSRLHSHGLKKGRICQPSKSSGRPLRSADWDRHGRLQPLSRRTFATAFHTGLDSSTGQERERRHGAFSVYGACACASVKSSVCARVCVRACVRV